MNNMSKLKEKYNSRQAQNYRKYLDGLVDKALRSTPAGGGTVKEIKAEKPKTAEDEVWESLTEDKSKVRCESQVVQDKDTSGSQTIIIMPRLMLPIH